MLSRSDIGKLRSLSVENLNEIGVEMKLTRTELVEFIIDRIKTQTQEEIDRLKAEYNALMEPIKGDLFNTVTVPLDTPTIAKAVEFITSQYPEHELRAYVDIDTGMATVGAKKVDTINGLRTTISAVAFHVNGHNMPQPEIVQKLIHIRRQFQLLNTKLREADSEVFKQQMIVNVLDATQEGRNIRAAIETAVGSVVNAIK
jgi:hypothetical protein